MTKKHKCWLLAALCCAALGYGLFTPTGALRLSVACSGHPLSALLVQINPPSYAFAAEGQIGYTLVGSHVPYEAPTDSHLENWVVTRHGPIYVGEYYGYG